MISAAAAIMVVVFLSFVLTPDVSVKQIGLGLAAAVLVDATVVRLVLVPAVMELLGRANWWLPSWLERVLPAGRARPLSGNEPTAVWPSGRGPLRKNRPRPARVSCEAGRFAAPEEDDMAGEHEDSENDPRDVRA